MADKKISQLTALSAANLAPSTDVLAIVDTSATETKKIVAQDLVNGVLNVASAVGIGTASPSYKLDVRGSGSIVSWSDGTTPGVLYSTGGYVGLTFPAQSGGFFINPTGNFCTISTSGVERVRIDSSGNLGLGVTPTTAWAGGKVFEFAGSGVRGSLFQSNSGVLSLAQNYYFSGSADVYVANGFATRYYQLNGTHVWNTAPNNTSGAGQPITFTQAMTLDASGNFGVGTTSPGYRLDVERSGDGITAGFAGGTYGIRFDNGGSFSSGASTIHGVDSTLTGSYQQLNINGSIVTFQTGATERGRFTAGGYFKASNDGTYAGITGTTHELRQSAGDNHTLVVHNTAATLSGSGARGIFINYTATPNSTDRGFIACFDGNSANERATIRSNGGLANYQTNDVNLSDERVKTDIAPLGSMWTKIKALEIVTFKYKDQTHDDDNIGLIAQQVEAVAPEFVDVDGWGETPEDGVPLKSIYTADMYHAAIKALQEAMARIESLEADMAALKGAK